MDLRWNAARLAVVVGAGAAGLLLFVAGGGALLGGLTIFGEGDASPAALLIIPGLAGLVLAPYLGARLSGNSDPAARTFAAIVLFAVIGLPGAAFLDDFDVDPAGALVPALALAAGLCIRNDDPVRWLSLGALALVSLLLASTGRHYALQGVLALASFPLAALPVRLPPLGLRALAALALAAFAALELFLLLRY
jgi:hypothetical protein